MTSFYFFVQLLERDGCSMKGFEFDFPLAFEFGPNVLSFFKAQNMGRFLKVQPRTLQFYRPSVCKLDYFSLVRSVFLAIRFVLSKESPIALLKSLKNKVFLLLARYRVNEEPTGCATRWN